jgi:hypothetical protein
MTLDSKLSKSKISSWLTLLGRLGPDGYSDKRISMFPMNSSENNGNGFATESVTGF